MLLVSKKGVFHAIPSNCDQKKLIRHLFVGYPGSVHDAKVFAASDIGRRPRYFFSEGQYIIGDSAYAKSVNLVVPFKRRHGQLTQIQKSFNKHISSYRVTVEHCIGLLKGRFQSLKEIRIQIDEAGHKKCCEWIKACAVLHNITMPCDPWVQEDDEVLMDICDENDEESFQFNEDQAGELKRAALCQIIQFKSL